MRILRTPEARFKGLADFPFAPQYRDVQSADSPPLRMHFVDEGPRDGPVVVLLHGEPTWSYLYRWMIPPLVRSGLRVIAPDLIGFGRSDKPAAVSDHSYRRHVQWVRELLLALDLGTVTLFCQDWGGLIGLRLVAEAPHRFNGVVAANTFLPTGRRSLPLAFRAWRAFARFTPVFPVSRIVAFGCNSRLSAAARRAYRAPFPSSAYMAGPRAMPRLVPTQPDDAEAAANRGAWRMLESYRAAFVTAFGTRDPILGGMDAVFQARIPGAGGQTHRRLARGGHFVQEDCPLELTSIISRVAGQARLAPADRRVG